VSPTITTPLAEELARYHPDEDPEADLILLSQVGVGRVLKCSQVMVWKHVQAGRLVVTHLGDREGIAIGDVWDFIERRAEYHRAIKAARDAYHTPRRRPVGATPTNAA
jgi:hypothetical protein